MFRTRQGTGLLDQRGLVDVLDDTTQEALRDSYVRPDDDEEGDFSQ